MVNAIWMSFIVIAVIVSFFTGKADTLTQETLNSAKSSVEYVFGMVGFLTLWMGILKIAEAAGLVQALGKLLQPLLKKLFPEIPDGHPALGAITANFTANIFGLGNAATPLGLKAMEHLQELNPKKDTATNAMCMFLAINTSSVTLLSVGVMNFRLANGSQNAAVIIGPTLIASFFSTAFAILAAKLLEKYSKG